MDTPEEEEFEEETITLEDTDADYDQAKIDEAFPVQPIEPPPPVEVETGFAIEAEPKRPPVVLQKLTLTFSNGRVVDFMGQAAMTVDEFRAGGKSFRLVGFDFSEPFVVATEDPQREELAHG